LKKKTGYERLWSFVGSERGISDSPRRCH